MNLLVHVCCGPCFTVPYQVYKREGFTASAFYYNPNIHPFSEYEHRLEVARGYCQDIKVDFIEETYKLEEYFQAIADHVSKPQRCRSCLRLRLERTAATAKAKGFKAFSTSLLVSPYQQHEDIKTIGADLADKYGVSFIYRDFRPRYHDSVVESRRLEMYRQSFCGCLFSERERILEKRAAKLRRRSKKLITAKL